ncbi:MAG: helix-turn-helix transcriptional regulator [Acidobacteria bacterium]|nr:helix-turn-helix transcriptional regulator [Acidobacteriota bacterium]
MSEQEAFERVLRSSYAAMLDDARCPEAFALIDETCGVKGTSLLVGQGPRVDGRVTLLGMYRHGQRRLDLESDYVANYYHRDERVPRIRRLAYDHLVPTTELFSAEELKASATYNEFCAKAECQNGLLVRLEAPRGYTHVTWAITEPVAPRGWDSSQIRMLERLLPHIRQLATVRLMLTSSGLLVASLQDLLGARGFGVLHLDRRRRIVAANGRAEDTLRSAELLSDEGGRLRACLPKDRRRFDRLLADALPPRGVAAVGGSVSLGSPPLLPGLVVHVKPTVGSETDYEDRRIAASVLIVESSRQPCLEPVLVAEALGLTPAEAKVAIWLTEGKRVGEIAEALGRTESTVYWHLSQIYARHGLSGQADLVRLVLSVA